MNGILRHTFLWAAAFGICNSALADQYEIDSAHATAGFAVKHLMVSNVRGTFSGLKGTVNYDPKNPSKSSVTASIDATTVDTAEKKRDDHLRSADFLNTEKHPTMNFQSKSVSPAGTGKLKVVGDLTINGVTKEVTLDVEGPTDEIKDPWGNVKRGATATTKLNRKDFGLTWNKVLETGALVVGEEVAVTIDLELTKKS